MSAQRIRRPIYSPNWRFRNRQNRYIHHRNRPHWVKFCKNHSIFYIYNRKNHKYQIQRHRFFRPKLFESWWRICFSMIIRGRVYIWICANCRICYRHNSMVRSYLKFKCFKCINALILYLKIFIDLSIWPRLLLSNPR